MSTIKNGKRSPKKRMSAKPAKPEAKVTSAPPLSPTGQLESILDELRVIRSRLDYLIGQINGIYPGSIQ